MILCSHTYTATHPHTYIPTHMMFCVATKGYWGTNRVPPVHSVLSCEATGSEDRGGHRRTASWRASDDVKTLQARGERGWPWGTFFFGARVERLVFKNREGCMPGVLFFGVGGCSAQDAASFRVTLQIILGMGSYGRRKGLKRISKRST